MPMAASAMPIATTMTILWAMFSRSVRRTGQRCQVFRRHKRGDEVGADKPAKFIRSHKSRVTGRTRSVSLDCRSEIESVFALPEGLSVALARMVERPWHREGADHKAAGGG